MRFRGRVLVACLAVVLVPVLVVGIGVRRDVEERLRRQYEERIDALASVIEEDLERESRAIASRLDGFAASLASDNRLRAALAGGPSDRSFLLDYASEAMRLTGLSVLQIQERSGRIVSSGHFRNAFDLIAPALPRHLSSLPDGSSVARMRTAEGHLVALTRIDSVSLGGRTYDLIGGVRVEEDFLERLRRDPELRVRLVLPGDGAVAGEREGAGASEGADVPTGPEAGDPDAEDPDRSDSDAVLARSVALPYLDVAAASSSGARAGRDRPAEARFEITWDGSSLEAVRRSATRWLLLVLAGATALAAALAAWLSGRLTKPLEALAAKTARVDLDRLDVDFASDRDDEVGELARLLGQMTERLRASARDLREAERRATLGEMARQVNHDVRNGLSPIRNVLRHLDRVADDEPEALPRVFDERRDTLASSVSYLETLAGNYARLSTRAGEGTADAGAVARSVAEGAAAGTDVEVRVEIDAEVPPVRGHEVALRRIVENLVTNAVDAVADGEAPARAELAEKGEVRETGGVPEKGKRDGRGGGGLVTVRVEEVRAGPPRETSDTVRTVRIAVEDGGAGMTDEQRTRAFDDFFTTKEEGTGLGLSVVRRLVRDLEGELTLESEPGRGTRIEVTLPAAEEDRT